MLLSLFKKKKKLNKDKYHIYNYKSLFSMIRRNIQYLTNRINLIYYPTKQQ